MSLLKRVFLNQLKNGCLLIPLPHPLQTKGPSCEWLSQSGFTGEVNNCGFTQLLVHFTLVYKIASHCSISICAKLVKPKPLKALTNGPPNSVPSYLRAIEKYIFKILLLQMQFFPSQKINWICQNELSHFLLEARNFHINIA